MLPLNFWTVPACSLLARLTAALFGLLSCKKEQLRRRKKSQLDIPGLFPSWQAVGGVEREVVSFCLFSVGLILASG